MLKLLLPIALSAVLVACGGGGGSSKGASTSVSPVSSSSSSVSSSAASSRVAAPQGTSVVRGDESATLDWNQSVNSTSYNIYVATESGIIPGNIGKFTNGRIIENVQPPYTVTDLTNGSYWYFVVTAVDKSSESLPGEEHRVIPSAVDPALEPTPQEVLVMELINRARANPQEEAERYSVGLNDGIDEANINADSKQPLALNLQLQTAARAHSHWMLANNMFSHTGIGGSTPSERSRMAGYILSTPWRTGENISVIGPAGIDSAALTTVALRHHENLFKSAGHRRNILNGDFRNIGVGQRVGDYTFTSGNLYNSSMLTESYAKSGNQYFLTGVAYEDTNNNDFYDVGEAMGDITLEVDGQFYQVFSSGAYSIPLNKGSYAVTIHGSTADFPIQSSITIDDRNLKLDVIKTRQGIVVR